MSNDKTVYCVFNTFSAIKHNPVSPQFAIKNRFQHRSKEFPKREHWLDWAREKYDVSTVGASCAVISPDPQLLSVCSDPLPHALGNGFGPLHYSVADLAKPQCSPGIAGYHFSSCGRKQS